MSRIPTVLFIVSILFPLISFAQQSDPDPVLRFTFDNSVVDSSGLNESIEVSGGYFIEDRHGNANSAYFFNADDAITIHDLHESVNKLSNETGVTFMTWIKFDSFPGVESRSIILERYDEFTKGYWDSDGYHFAITNIGQMHVRARNSAQHARLGLKNYWVHIAVTFKDGIVSFFVDGEKFNTKDGWFRSADTAPMTIGSTQFSKEKYIGGLDDLRLYDSVVSDSLIAVAADQKFGSADPDKEKEPIFYMSFDDAVVDSMGYHPNITASGGEYVSDRNDNAKSAYEFDGVDDVVTVDNLGAIAKEPLFSDSDDYSISFWVKVNSFASEQIFSTILETNYTNLGIFENGIVIYRRYDDYLLSIGEIEPNKWTHITIVSDSETNTKRFYKDGVFALEKEVPGDFLQNSSGSIRIGNSNEYNSAFNGVLDEIKVFDEAIDLSIIHSEAGLDPIPDYTSTNILDLRFDGVVTDSSIANNSMVSAGEEFSANRFGEENKAYSGDALKLNMDDVGNPFKNFKEFTITTWIKINSFSDNESMLIQKPTTLRTGDFDTYSPAKGFQYYISRDGRIYLDVDSGNRERIVKYNRGLLKVLPQDEWFHLATTFGDETVKHYINGEEQVIYNKWQIDPTYLHLENENEIVIGNSQSGEHPFDGSLDNFHVYNYVLTEDEINEQIDFQHVDLIPQKENLLYLPFDSIDNEDAVYYGDLLVNKALPSRDRFRINDQAYNFNGNDDAIILQNPNAIYDNLNSGMTLSAWVKIDSLSYTSNSHTSSIINRTDQIYADKFMLGLKQRSPSYWFDTKPDGDILSLNVNGITASIQHEDIRKGTWLHVAGTYDGNVAKLYLNGELIKEDEFITKIRVKDPEIYIGNDRDSRYPFFGSIDDVRMYNYAVDESTIADFYEDRFRGYNLKPRQLLSIPFDQSISDTSSFEHSLNQKNIVLTEDRFGRFENSASFDGIDSQIKINTPNTTFDSLNNGLTLATWVNMKRDSLDYPATSLISRDDGYYDKFYLGIRDGAKDHRGADGQSNDYEESVIFTIGDITLYYRDEPVQPGDWFHVAGTFDGEFMRLYLNGVMLLEDRHEVLIDITESDIFIGNNSAGTRPFYGDLDEVQIYNYALSDSAITELIDIETVAVSNEEERTTEVPREFVLQQNYPNPFNPTTVIGFDLPEANEVILRVYNTIGHEVITLINERMTSGTHSVTFDASGLSSGIYFYQLKYNGLVRTKKMILVK